MSMQQQRMRNISQGQYPIIYCLIPISPEILFGTSSRTSEKASTYVQDLWAGLFAFKQLSVCSSSKQCCIHAGQDYKLLPSTAYERLVSCQCKHIYSLMSCT